MTSIPAPTVYVVDDDEVALKSLCFVINSLDLLVQGFSSPKEFLQTYQPEWPGCLVVDLRMPEMTGLELQTALLARGATLPIIVVTAHGTVAACSRAFKAGAVDFMEKPLDNVALAARVRAALEKDQADRQFQEQRANFSQRLSSLTPREYEVMDRLVSGKAMKEIATEFDTSFQTVAKHRTRLLEKLGVANDVELVRLALATRDAAGEKAE